MGFEDKSPEVADFLEKNFGTETAIKTSHCVPPPIGCGRPVALEVNPSWVHPESTSFEEGPMPFRDELSLKEYKISGLCQACQDRIFSEMSDW